MTDSVSRKFALGLAVILASLTMGFSGVTSSFFMLGAMRALHGALNSASNPFSFGLIADYFPPDKRATANAIL
jgi:MFS family permease